MTKIPLIIKLEDFNLAVKNKLLISELRKLTLHDYSGMNVELNHLEKVSKNRKVKSKALLAYHEDKLIGWALLSRESSDFYFSRIDGRFDPKYGVLFEVFVEKKYRRKGVATTLLQVARKQVGKYKLCFAPWDSASHGFYDNFNHYEHMDV